MKNSATAPAQNRFAATSYRFLLKFKGESESRPLRAKPFDALRLVWHDYPGEWFEQDVSGPEEAQRRVETFRALLGSDVALLLVDGQKLVDNAGEEERYLKSLLSNFRNSLLLLKDDLLQGGQPLVAFPRIWVLALSKADLLPDLDVHGFKELVIEKVGDDIVELRAVLAGLMDSGSALSVGEDFVLISSAKFTTGAIEVAQRIGIDLVLPMAAVLPFERHVRWAHAEKVSRRVALELIGSAEGIAAAFGAATTFLSPLLARTNKFAGAIGLALSRLAPSLEDLARSAGARIEAADAAAATKRQNLADTLDGFRRDLDAGEDAAVLARSLR